MSIIPKYTFGESMKALFGLAMKSFERTSELDARIARLERLPGEKGEQGESGFSLDDFTFEYDGHRTLTLKFERGDLVKTKEIKMPVMIDCGVYRDTESYEKGDGTTWAGSYWVAQKDNPEKKPGEENSGWRLVVKKGRDGRDREVVKSEPSRNPIQLNPKRES
jgi:hypothetical protein